MTQPKTELSRLRQELKQINYYAQRDDLSTREQTTLRNTTREALQRVERLWQVLYYKPRRKDV